MAPQIKAFSQKRKEKKIMQGLKSAILVIFKNGQGWLCPIS
jgi:hypothetical protein